MSPCHNLEPSLVARDSSRLLSVKPNEWMHLSPFYTPMHGEWLRYAKSTSQFHWRFLLVRDVRGFQVNPLCRHDITSPFPPSGNGGYVRNLDVFFIIKIIVIYYLFIHLFFNVFFLFVYCYFNCMHSNNFRRNMYYCLERKMQSLPHFSRKHNWDALT